MVVVNMEELRKQAKDRLGGAGAGGVIGHLYERSKLLQEIIGECESSLHGGYGKTGRFQGGLHSFSKKFTELLEDFNTEHVAFTVFLEGLRDQMNAAAGAYQDTELRNTNNISSITRALNSE